MYSHLETMKKELTGPALQIKIALFTIKARCILFSTINFFLKPHNLWYWKIQSQEKTCTRTLNTNRKTVIAHQKHYWNFAIIAVSISITKKSTNLT